MAGSLPFRHREKMLLPLGAQDWDSQHSACWAGGHPAGQYIVLKTVGAYLKYHLFPGFKQQLGCRQLDSSINRGRRKVSKKTGRARKSWQVKDFHAGPPFKLSPQRLYPRTRGLFVEGGFHEEDVDGSKIYWKNTISDPFCLESPLELPTFLDSRHPLLKC